MTPNIPLLQYSITPLLHFKKCLILFICLLWLLIPCLAHGGGIIIGLEGEAVVYWGGDEEGEILKLKDTVYAGDVIETKAESKAKIQFQDGSILSLGENTKLKVKWLNIKTIINNIMEYLIRAYNISKSIAGKLLFDNCTFNILKNNFI